MIEKAFRALRQYFSNGHILSLEELCHTLETDEQDQSVISWYNDMINLKYLQEIPDHLLCEVFINRNKYYSKTNGENYTLKTSIDTLQWQLHFEIIAHQHKIEWNYNKPYASFYIQVAKKKLRLTLIHYSLNPQGRSHAFFRNISITPYPLSSYIDQKGEVILKDIANNQMNILICGATGSGKTSFISSLINTLPKQEHIVLIEDTKEINPTPNSTELLSQDKPHKSLVDYCRYCLRMSPDRIILGEMRGAEVIPFFLLMNTGHRGLMSTIHASNPVDGITKSAFLFSLFNQSGQISYETALKLVCQNINIAISLKERKVESIIKVLGSEKQNCFFEEIYNANSDKTNQREIFL